MPGWSTCVVLLRMSFDADCDVIALVSTAESVMSGSAIAVAPVTGAGVTTSGPRAKPPTMLIFLPLAMVMIAALPLAARPPPFAAVQAESIITEPSNCAVGPPEKSIAGQPLRPLGQDEFEGSRSTTE